MNLQRKPTNLSLNAALIDEARGFNINLSRAAEAGVQAAVDTARAAKWQDENQAAMADYNRWTQENGLPLLKYHPIFGTGFETDQNGET